MYTNLEVENFDVNLKNNIVTISFTAKDYLTYEIIKVDNYKEHLLKTIENKSELIEIKDENLKEQKQYSYYIKVNNPLTNSYNLTEKIIILTNKSANSDVKNELIDKEIQKQKNSKKKDNLGTSWYFYS